MKKSFAWMIAVSFLALIFTNGCSTTEEAAPFDITGAWQFSMTVTGIPIALAQNLTFTGSINSGIVTGWNLFGDTGDGTYTVTGSTISFSISYWDSGFWFQEWTFNGSTSAANYMSGTGTWYDEFGPTTLTHTWTANKL